MAVFFIKRPIFAIVLSLIITIIGFIAAVNLPVAQYPQISPPTVEIKATYQGANADDLDQSVAQTIEEKVNGVDGMVSMSSSSSDDGSYTLSVQFESGKDPDSAAVQTQNRVAEANASLPNAVQSAGVTTRKASQDMAMVFNLYSDNDVFSRNFLKNYGSIYLVDDIKRVKGVGDVTEFGADYSMRIWLQPEKMARLGIDTSTVVSAIEAQNVQAPSGSLGGMPASSQQEFQYTARVKGRLTDTESFGNIIIQSNTDGAFTRLKDIARIELGSKDYSNQTIINGHPSSGFAVKLASDANALETIGKVKTILEEASKKFPDGMKYTVSVDNTQFIRESMIEVGKTFAEALLLVIIVVYLFLQSWRATLIPLLAIPVSLIGTFGAFVILGFSINTLTLFAMVLAIGLVVDDAIVVIEAVEHHMRYKGLSPVEATRQAMSEVSGPVVAIAFVLASVFLPVAFFGGMMGVLYKQFALTIAVAMALSALVALSLTPALCTLLLKPFDIELIGKGIMGHFFEIFNRGLARGIEYYGKGLDKWISNARLCMLLFGVVIILTGALYKMVPSSFVPNEDQGRYIAAVTLPEASSLNRTAQILKDFSQTIQNQPGITNVMSMAGQDMLGGGSKPSTGSIFILMDPWAQRQSPQLQLNSVIEETLTSGRHLDGASVMVLEPPALPGLGNVGGFTLYLEDRGGGTLEALDGVAQKFVEAAQQRPEIASIKSSFKASTPGYELEVDREKTEKMGISVENVFTTLNAFIGGTQVNDFNKFGRTYKVIAQAEPSFRSDVDAMRYLFVKNSSGTMVPLNTLVKPKKVSAPSVITRYDGVRAVKINGTQAMGFSSGQAIAALEEVAAQTLPSDYSYEWSGQSREEKESGDRAPIVFGMAIIFVFLCLAGLYESWSVPFAIVFAVPNGVFGAFLFQYVRNMENNVYMQIGLVMLIGLAAKNAILIVEFAKIRVDNGMSPIQAVTEAAKIRLRPILMTSLAFIIGCIPLAFATGAGASARNSMGTAVVGGMFMATALGILMIPVFFVVVEKVTSKHQALRN
jgi:multidrug efflux pump